MFKDWKSDEMRFALFTKGTATRILGMSIASISLRMQGKIPNGISIWYFSEPSISLGYFQDIDTDIDLELAKKHNIEICRRLEGMGGGVIFLDPEGFMGIGILADKTIFPTMEEAFHKSGAALTEMYKILGVKDAKYYPPDDVRAEGSGRKMGAVGVTEVGGLYLVNSSNFPGYIKSDLLPQIARIPEEKWKDKKIKSFGEYQGGVEAEIGHRPDPFEFASAAYKAFGKVFGVKFRIQDLTEEEWEMCEDFAVRAQSDEHMFAVSSKKRFGKIPPDHKYGIGRYKSGKLVESRVLLDSKGIIKDMFFAGDFYAKPVPIMREMEESLKGVSAKDDKTMLEKIKVAYQKPNWETSEISPEDFLKALVAGCKAALESG
ncbi:MAG: lipoate--protein ligase family protein [Candidatus Jordarchaeum sp.]|uniref:lipoate--protein ligase family protein n=1 Tax=Candidatus Jordarchaeum sp. TaxID=2823881 RepID=UPI00404A90F2